MGFLMVFFFNPQTNRMKRKKKTPNSFKSPKGTLYIPRVPGAFQLFPLLPTPCLLSPKPSHDPFSFFTFLLPPPSNPQNPKANKTTSMNQPTKSKIQGPFLTQPWRVPTSPLHPNLTHPHPPMCIFIFFQGWKFGAVLLSYVMCPEPRGGRRGENATWSHENVVFLPLVFLGYN